MYISSITVIMKQHRDPFSWPFIIMEILTFPCQYTIRETLIKYASFICIVSEGMLFPNSFGSLLIHNDFPQMYSPTTFLCTRPWQSLKHVIYPFDITRSLNDSLFCYLLNNAHISRHVSSLWFLLTKWQEFFPSSH